MTHDIKEDDALKASVRDALRAIRLEAGDESVSPQVRDAVMRAWDVRQAALPISAPGPIRAVPHPRRRHGGSGAVRAAFAIAAAGVLAVSAATWRPASTNRASETGTLEQPTASGEWDTTGLLSAADVALGDDPTSLQVVRMNVDASLLAAYGYVIADPAAGAVPIEMLVGIDGVPRAIRALGTGPRVE